MFSNVIQVCSIIKWDEFIEYKSDPFPSTFGLSPVAHSVCLMTARGFEWYYKDISHFVFLSSLLRQDKITAPLQNVARCRFNLIIETQHSSWIYTGWSLMNELNILEDVQSFNRLYFK